MYKQEFYIMIRTIMYQDNSNNCQKTQYSRMQKLGKYIMNHQMKQQQKLIKQTKNNQQRSFRILQHKIPGFSILYEIFQQFQSSYDMVNNINNNLKIINNQFPKQIQWINVISKKICNNCHCRNKILKKCKNCLKVFYCSKKCQKIDWNIRNHRVSCLTNHIYVVKTYL